VPLEWPRFGLVSMFNVLDRCRSPVAMLKKASALVRPHGYLVLAVPLPMDAFHQRDARGLTTGGGEQEGVFPGYQEVKRNHSWEPHAEWLLQTVLPAVLPRQLRRCVFTRAPYYQAMAGVPRDNQLYDNIVIACQKH